MDMMIRLVFILLVGIAWVRLCGGTSKGRDRATYGAPRSPHT